MAAAGWEIAGLTASDLLVMALMVAVFALAVLAPYPRGRR